MENMPTPPYQNKNNHAAQYKPIKIRHLFFLYTIQIKVDIFIYFYFQNIPAPKFHYFTFLNSPVIAAFLWWRCEGAVTLFSKIASLFYEWDSMHSMGINSLVGASTVWPVLGTFTGAPLSSLSDLLLITSITLSKRHKCLGALSSCINKTLTLIKGELLFNDLDLTH